MRDRREDGEGKTEQQKEREKREERKPREGGRENERGGKGRRRREGGACLKRAVPDALVVDVFWAASGADEAATNSEFTRWAPK